MPVDNALLALREQIIRSKSKGLAHLETLLILRDVPMPEVVPAKRRDAARRRQMRALVLEVLGDEPKPLREIVAHVAVFRPELEPRSAYMWTTQALERMRG